jgi:cellobiose phosphorylase
LTISLTLIDDLRRLQARFRASGWSKVPQGPELPLRAELYSAEQMESHGKALAASHRLSPGRTPDRLLARLAANEAALVGVCTLLTEAVKAKRRITPAGEWLLDNFYLIEEQVRTSKRHLPKGYSLELPRLAQGPSTGHPRVYDIALEVISHGDGRVDTENLSRFVAAYQSVTPLNVGELWAIPIMLRLAVIENLRRVGVTVAAGGTERDLADTWADQMMETAEKDPKSLILVIADMARSNPPLMSPFVAELARRLQGRGPALALPLTWVEQRLSEMGLTIEQRVQAESQTQAANQVTVSNSISSLRILGALDWRDFVEDMSVVEQTLREDPSGVYWEMDFATRDRYRHATEAIARTSLHSEVEVAGKAVELARLGAAAAEASGEDSRAAHVGFYLIDRGRAALERAVGSRPDRTERLRRAAGRFPLLLYLGAIAAVITMVTALLFREAQDGGAPYWSLGPLAVLFALSASPLAVALVNWVATLLVTPHPLPRMDFSEGIPAGSRTLIAVPTLLTDVAGVESLVEGLEVRFLANRDPSLHFGLLTDLRDASQETLPEDGPLIELARVRIEELNEKYSDRGGEPHGQPFFLFHRPRRFNPQERVWMGYERKRGKLEDLNRLLRGSAEADTRGRFSLILGGPPVRSSVKYVITLDTDTQLPRDAARHFVATMAHPLNHPRYDPSRKRVVEGYGILQPRVSISLPATSRSLYARLYGGDPGLDPYTRAVSDVYQDLFGEGSFIGKGIYDVDAFEKALGGRLPENRILSHDLLEGCYVRAGLLSDQHLYEDCPDRYRADVTRRHRWIRGDWQLAGWLMRRVVGGRVEPAEGAGKSSHRNPLSELSQWKLIDNLRRSLVPPALTLTLVAAWLLLAASWFWVLSVIGILLVPALCASILDLFRKPEDVLIRQHLRSAARGLVRHGAQVAFEFACLPYEALFSLDAILRTTWRMLVSQRRLLEWNPSSEADRESAIQRHRNLSGVFRQMWLAPTFACAVAGLLLGFGAGSSLQAGPVLLLWFSSPALAWWLSRPLVRREAVLTADQRFFLRRLARRTWAFFDTFVGPQDHWLPPDNYQDSRAVKVAHRTSPTNMGLSLLANLSAYDFGYLPMGRLVERTSSALHTMSGLGRHRGHFYNWYDTETLQPLPPLYVSTVDSGNLAGHLLTLRSGLTALLDDRLVGPRLFDGLEDALSILAETAALKDEAAIQAFAQDLTLIGAAPPQTAGEVFRSLDHLTRMADALSESIAESEPQGEPWALSLAQQCRGWRDEVAFLAPWVRLDGAPVGMEALTPRLSGLSLRETERLEAELGPVLSRRLDAVTAGASREWLVALRQCVNEASTRARDRMGAIEILAVQAGDFARVDYDFLYDKSRHLITIGYNVSDHRIDSSYYDLLASEARLACFVGIAQGALPQESWFALGRLLTTTGGDPVLLSWSGSMFEYLMPLLIMPTYDNTLLDQTCRAAVARQIEYGRQRGVPWGMSESAYNTVDLHLNYQYRAFGVPGLGLKRGLAEDVVVSPYASALALMVAPEEACANLEWMEEEGFLGQFGFFEAVDYTPARQQRGQSRAVVRAFMAHHQGMSLLALDHLLQERPMQKRFEADRLFQATLLLLQERVPRASALFSLTSELEEVRSRGAAAEPPIRRFATPDTKAPEVQLLSNGRYHVMVTNAGGGYSRFKELAVTRWREDATCDDWGTFCYVRDLASGIYWSSAFQPTRQPPASYEVIFSEGRAEYRRRDAPGEGDFETHTDIVVSPEDDIELRRVRITNRSRQRREIDVTSYAEVVMAPPAADAMHPAFSNLFVQTEIVSERRAILCTRRPRSASEQAPWMLHLMAAHGADLGSDSYETDRLNFIGRGGSAAGPLAMKTKAPLSAASGSVLDPIVAIRCGVFLDAGQTVTVDIVTGVAPSREAALVLIERYQDRHLADRVFELTWTHSQVVRRQLNANEADSQIYARMAGPVIYANPGLRADPAVLIRNRRGQSGLWGYAISGDLPIVLLRIKDAANIDLVRQLVQAHAYWRLKGLAVDLVIWNEDHAGYLQQLQEQIMGLITSGIEASVIDRPGGIFVRMAAQISTEDRVLLQSVARLVITDDRGSLLEQLDRGDAPELRPPALQPSRSVRTEAPLPALPPGPDLILQNGIGGFTRDGTEYVISLGPGALTPAPWVNVLANPGFGTIVSESGSAYTWSENAHEFRLTPWHNDPVSDPSGEALYLRDEETGQVWSPTPSAARAGAPYVVRHGFGYSVFETKVSGVRSELWVYVATDAPIKFSVLKVINESGRPRRLSATGYVEWVLGDLRPRSAMHVSTEVDAKSGGLCARNRYNTEFPDRVAFFDTDEAGSNLTGDRREFVGRNGTLRRPAALNRSRLSGRTGAGLDPCAALQVNFELLVGQEREVVFRLGVAKNRDEALKLLQRFRGASAARAALEAVWQQWKRTLGAVQVETPDPSINVLGTGWLIYQTLSCRLWARSGFYQSGGAIGFRDQLQDVMALLHTRPDLLRAHLLLCAGRQFQEGDVQHWWHPPTGRGVRTRCSDDYLWLPLATCRYVLGTGDTGVLDETAHSLEGRPVKPEDDSYYDLPARSTDTVSLYEHCVRAIRHGLRFGEHGLPLMGSGDWNDGMNLVGLRGKGESVWLGFFLHEVLKQFTILARMRGDDPFAEHCIEEGLRLRTSLEKHGWDGDWFRRAYFDDGTPLGSAGNPECRIDSLSQSWSVLSGAADEGRSRAAMRAVDERLVRRGDGLVQLLDPPFDKSGLDPGYIRGYVPGVRENGGQYTHAAIWTTMAFAALGERGRAWELMDMINPVNHGRSKEGIAIYKVEPYVVAADVYAVAPHTGRGGWTWYTGSAGWMYRLILESLLGLTLEGERLRVAPCLPSGWPGLTVHYRYRETEHHIVFSQAPLAAGSGGPGANVVISVTVDGDLRPEPTIPLVDDRRDHHIEVVLA